MQCDSDKDDGDDSSDLDNDDADKVDCNDNDEAEAAARLVSSERHEAEGWDLYLKESINDDLSLCNAIGLDESSSDRSTVLL